MERRERGGRKKRGLGGGRELPRLIWRGGRDGDGNDGEHEPGCLGFRFVCLRGT